MKRRNIFAAMAAAVAACVAPALAREGWEGYAARDPKRFVEALHRSLIARYSLPKG